MRSEKEESVRSISRNIYDLLLQIFSYPTSKREALANRGAKMYPFALLSLFICSVIIIQTGILKPLPQLWWGAFKEYDIIRTQVLIGLVMFFISVNGFLSLRIYEYIVIRTETRKKVAAEYDYIYGHSGFAVSTGSGPSNVNSNTTLRGPRPFTDLLSSRVSDDDVNSFPQESITIESHSTRNDNLSAVDSNPDKARQKDTNFDHNLQFKRRFKHISPQFNKIQLTFGNLGNVIFET
jgi:hypothetical protein